jgi:ketosteroid isomerase-like protein
MAPTEEEMIDRLLRGHEAFSNGDYDTAIELMHPDIEFATFGEPSPVKGVEALRAWMEPDAFESQRIEPLRWKLKGNTALVWQHVSARGAGSGIELDTHSWSVWTFDDEGRPTRLESFPDHMKAEALAAAGLSEEEWPPEAEGGRPPGA